MKLSALQKFILKSSAQAGGRLSKRPMERYYEKLKTKPKTKDIKNIITKSVERLIDKGLLVGEGIKTQKKWFIKEVRLTPAGKRLAKTLFGVQSRLPLTKTKKTKPKAKN